MKLAFKVSGKFRTGDPVRFAHDVTKPLAHDVGKPRFACSPEDAGEHQANIGNRCP